MNIICYIDASYFNLRTETSFLQIQIERSFIKGSDGLSKDNKQHNIMASKFIVFRYDSDYVNVFLFLNIANFRLNIGSN